MNPNATLNFILTALGIISRYFKKSLCVSHPMITDKPMSIVIRAVVAEITFF